MYRGRGEQESTRKPVVEKRANQKDSEVQSMGGGRPFGSAAAFLRISCAVHR